MSKETFYFSHDYNARNDEDCVKLIMKESWEGYGLYWAIIEKLYSEGGYLEYECECIAFDLRTDSKRIERIVNEYNLFKINDKNKFYSESVLRRLRKRKEKSKKAQESAQARWSKKKNHANALPTQSDSNAIKESKIKESKIKESKINKTKFEKTLDDFYLMRKKIKKPMTEKAIEILLKKLDELSCSDEDTKVKILEQSILNSWQGIFPLKDDKKDKQSHEGGYI